MPGNDASLLDLLKSWPLAVLPHQFLSRLVRSATRWRASWWKNPLIRLFIRHFNVDMSEAAAANAEDYADFNRFFTRVLKPGARAFPDDQQAITSPVDGRVSQAGDIRAGRLIQAKGRDYSLTALLGDDQQSAADFENGKFATLYLSPRDYHRTHMPCQGELLDTTYVPGRLFSVAPHTTRAIPNLFTRNERLVALFETSSGPMAMVLVGAIFVACMETVWEGVIQPSRQGIRIRTFNTSNAEKIRLQRGDEMGRFNMGSTVILLYGPEQADWNPDLAAGQPLRVGQTMGNVKTGH
jgi:phosphatidylserine decarboxylase